MGDRMKITGSCYLSQWAVGFGWVRLHHQLLSVSLHLLCFTVSLETKYYQRMKKASAQRRSNG